VFPYVADDGSEAAGKSVVSFLGALTTEAMNGARGTIARQ
jgi:hypothetical protein